MNSLSRAEHVFLSGLSDVLTRRMNDAGHIRLWRRAFLADGPRSLDAWLIPLGVEIVELNRHSHPLDKPTLQSLFKIIREHTEEQWPTADWCKLCELHPDVADCLGLRCH